MTIIERPESAANEIVWGMKDAILEKGAQLRVRDTEHGVLMRWGSVLGSLKSGTHTLDPGAIPFLYSLFDPGSTTGQADVFFVAAGEHGWHAMSAEPRTLHDVRTGQDVDVRFTGSFSMELTDPVKVLVGLAFTHAGIYEYVESLVDRACRDVATEMVRGGLSVLDLLKEEHARALAARTIEAVAPKLSEMAVRVVRFGSLLVHIADADQQRLRGASGFAPGARVVVRWTDGSEYPGVVAGVEGEIVHVRWDAGGEAAVPSGQVRAL